MFFSEKMFQSPTIALFNVTPSGLPFFNLFNVVFSSNTSQHCKLHGIKQNTTNLYTSKQIFKNTFEISRESQAQYFPSPRLEKCNLPTLLLHEVQSRSLKKKKKTEPFCYKEKVQRYKMKCESFLQENIPSRISVWTLARKKRILFFIAHLTPIQTTLFLMSATLVIY